MSNLFSVWTHPHNTTNVKDESATNAVQNIVLPLHRPHFCIFSAKGPANTIDWYTGSEAINEFGESTFERNGGFWRNEQTFLTEAVFPNQGCFLTRLVDPAATKASVVIELSVTTGVMVPQWERDDEGNYIEDENGDLKPLIGTDDNQVEEPGVTVRLSARQLSPEETFKTAKKHVMEVGDSVTTTYPIIACQYDSAGSWGNRAGFKFYCRANDQDDDALELYNGLMYGFAPVEKPYQSDTPDYLGTIYDSSFVQFVMNPAAYDADTSRQMGANDTIFRLYTEAESIKNILPFSVYVYEDYFKEAADIIKNVETGVNELTSPYMVNICTFTDTNGNAYPHVLVDTTKGSIPLTDVYVNYLLGGDDGDTSNEKFEELYRSFLNFKLVPELQDHMHYPITHMYDVGYSTTTKNQMLDFMGGMPNIKVTMATQDASKDLYDMDTAISAGSVLRTRALLTPESELYGTQACRAEIMVQAGHLNNKNFPEIVPHTFWLCGKRGTYQNASFLKGDLGPDPNNRVTEFRDVNFIPYSKQQKEICWKNALNYCEYGRMDRLFFAGVQSVYKNKTSMLADVWFTDAIIYLKYIIDWAWADTANAKLPLPALSQMVTSKIREAAVTAFGSKFTLSECEFYQTEEEALLGTTYHVRTVLIGDSPNLIWNSDIIVRRSNLDSANASA